MQNIEEYEEEIIKDFPNPQDIIYDSDSESDDEHNDKMELLREISFDDTMDSDEYISDELMNDAMKEMKKSSQVTSNTAQTTPKRRSSTTTTQKKIPPKQKQMEKSKSQNLTKKRITSIEPNTALYDFVKSSSEDEEIVKNLFEDFSHPHWQTLRARMTTKSRKGRWSELEYNLILKYINMMKKSKFKTNDSQVKHLVCLIIGRSWRAFENEWDRQYNHTKSPSDTFVQSFNTLKSIFESKKQNEEMVKLYNDLLKYMKMYKELAVQQNNALSQANASFPTNKFNEMIADMEIQIEKINQFRTLHNTQLQDRLTKLTIIE